MNSDTQQCIDPLSNPSQSPTANQQQPSPYQEVKEATGEQLKQVASDLKQSGGQALQTAKDAGNHFVGDQKEKIAAQLDRYTGAVKAACESLQSGEANALANPAQRAGQQMERAAQYLREHNLTDFLDDMGNLARRRPEIVFGTMFLAGLAAVRFLKASTHHEQRGVEANRNVQTNPNLTPAF